MSEKKWHVLYSKPRWEKKLDESLVKKGFESWCPLNKVQKQWSDRKKIVEEPLFKSYVFVKINEAERTEILMTPGALNFVYYLRKPAIIRDVEIETIKLYLQDGDAKVEIVDASVFKENSKVKIKQGIFLNAEGKVLRTGKKKIYVLIESLASVMVVEFKTEHLLKI